MIYEMRRHAMRKWIGFFITGILLAILLSAVACTKSKLPPAPTVVMTGQAVQASKTPTTAAGGQTVVAADTTPTPEEAETPIPTMTPVPGATPTNTTAPSPTPVPGATATTAPPAGGEFEYVVKTGDTLWGLAVRFGTTVEAIMERNGLSSHVIYKGQKLAIAGTSGGETVTHVVQPGENLFRISLKYGTTVGAIAAANGIINPSRVYAGQKLTIPTGSAAPGGGVTYHVVQRGETLSSIALKYGTTSWKIAAANGISNPNYIYAGRTLRIP
jgi:LysM repeat protein